MTQQNNTPEKSVATRAKEAMNKAKKPGTLAGLSTKSIQDVFSAYRGMIAQALPRHLTAERVIQTATTLFTRNPEIAECTAESLLGAVMQSSILGFEPVHSLGHCYLVPFYNKNVGKKEVQFIVGYRGMIELANRSEKLKTIYAEVVREHDYFEYEFGLEPKISHRPAEGSRGKITHVYAVSHYVNGGYNFVVLTKADVERYRMRSASQNNQDKPTFVWATDYEAMAKKTAIRRLFPYLHCLSSCRRTSVQTERRSIRKPSIPRRMRRAKMSQILI